MGQSNFLQALGWAVLNSLWQMAMLWVIYQLLTGVFRSVGASRKSRLATVFLITGFAWFVFTFVSILWSFSGQGAIPSGFININGDERLNNWLSQSLPVASIIYLALLLLPILHFVRNYRYVQVIRTYGITRVDVEWRMFVKKVAAQMGINKPVHIWISDLVTSPLTIGYLKPIILIPIAAVNHLNTQQLEAVILHELAHIRRFDYLINLIIKSIQAILYFNPFVKAFVQIIEREREKSCDQMVMQYQYEPHGYASALLVLEKANHQPKPLAVAAAGKKNDLLHRIEWIMGVEKKPAISFNKLAGMLAGLLCIITLNGLIIMSQEKLASKKANQYASYSSFTSPLYFFTDDQEKRVVSTETKTDAEEVAITNKLPTPIHIRELSEPDAPHESADPIINVPVGFEEHIEAAINPYAVAVAKIEAPVKVALPKLDALQELQVKQALEASRQVLTVGQWKEVEKTVADVFTEQQKEQLKADYEQQIAKMDWKKYETKLRGAYDKVNWDKINTELNTAVVNIRLDSIQHVYNMAISDLSKIEKELVQNGLSGLPDSYLTRDVIDQKKKELEKAILKVKAVKQKKVIHL